MIQKLLIANRGEIAMRVIRTAKEMGIGTVAVHSEADSRALHAMSADERVAIGPAAPRDSYLKIEHILAATAQTGADAVHPGYGFLSENAEFARACRKAGLIFVGPPTEAILAMGSKTAARAAAMAADVPIIAGSPTLESLDHAKEEARRIGYPVLLKPALGGGGIGMIKLHNEADLEREFDKAKDKSQRLFGEGSVYIEKLLMRPRHVEIQVAGDNYGNLVHLGERECSVQRRHQKVLEETPSPAVTPELRKRMVEAALRLARHVSYSSLGTLEMLVSEGQFYFLEMNTRLQVEHTVTEEVTGLDLVEWQIRIAMGEELPALQSQIEFNGHAIQCRIYAENPDKGFLPSPGKIEHFLAPAGPNVRNDVAVATGDFVTPFYDPLIAKLVIHGDNRQQAIARALAAVADYRIDGIMTNLAMHKQVLENPAFVSGDYATDLLKAGLGLKA